MIVLNKKSDNKFKGFHPNGIDEGYEETIDTDEIPSIHLGVSYYFGNLRTSMVTKIISDTKDRLEFETLNSTYVVELK